MKCAYCDGQATVHVTASQDGGPSTLHVCEKCAPSTGSSVSSASPANSPFGFRNSNFEFSSLLGIESPLTDT